jgi:hypothetical protein
MTIEEREAALNKRCEAMRKKFGDMMPAFLPNSFWEGLNTDEEKSNKLLDLMEKVVEAHEKLAKESTSG